jgi:Raf kinase inhibitor-like YbhB/YbcL family protein
MAPLQHTGFAFFFSASLALAACGDDSTPASNPQLDSAVVVNDAGARDSDAGSDSGPRAVDSGNTGAIDSGSGGSTAGTTDAGGTSAIDSAVATASDASAVATPSDAAPGDAANDAGAGSDAGSSAGAFTLTSPAFANAAGCAKDMAAPCKVFPEENVSYMNSAASETENISPELSWTGVPAGTKSFAVVLQDLTNGMAHWVLWNIPGSATKLEKNVPKGNAMPATPAGSRQCNAGFAAGDGYFGPGSRCNVYEFVVYALSAPMFSPTPATDAGQVRTQLQALGAGILGSASLRGRANYMMMCAN